MQPLQREQKQKVSEARNPDRGLVLVNTGDGKGKSRWALATYSAQERDQSLITRALDRAEAKIPAGTETTPSPISRITKVKILPPAVIG